MKTPLWSEIVKLAEEYPRNKMITKIYHKKNELFQVEFYQDKECTNLIKDLPYSENAKKSDISNFYIELKEGDITPITSLLKLSRNVNDYFYTPYLPSCQSNQVKTLDDITPNLSKYIPKDNAVLFLSEEEANKHSDNCESWFLYQKDFPTRRSNSEMDIRDWKTITIFLTHGTESELKKANEIAEELKEEYGVEKVNIFVLHCFIHDVYNYNSSFADDFYKQNYKDAYDELCSIECKPDVSKKEYKTQFEAEKLEHKQECFINKIITTNSTGILEPQDEERLQILDCYDIFNDYLKGE